MADKRVTVTIEAVDKASATIKNVSSQLSSLGKLSGLSGLSKAGSAINSIGNAMSSIKGKASLAAAGITMAVNGFNKLYSASKQNFISGLSKIGNVCKAVISALGGVAKGFLGIIEKVTGADLSFSGLAQSAVDYEQNMKKVETITGATGKTLNDLNDKATQLGRDTSFTAGQIASGMVEMAQQGWQAKDIIEGMNSVTALAVVGNMKLSDASYQVASALNQFKTDASEADRYANVMTNTFLNSGATVKDFGASLKYVGSLAGSMNIPIEELGTAIGILGDNGIKGTQAGTVLRRVISNLSNPTKTVAKAIEDYNLQGAQQKILNGDLVGGFKEMSEKLSGLNAEEKANAAYSIAGMYALSGFLGLVNTSPAKFDEMYQAIKNGEGVYDTMDKMLQTVQGQMLLFVSKVQTGAKQVYDAIQGYIVKGMDTLNTSLDMLLDGKVLEMFSYLADESKKWGEAIATGITNGIKNVTSFINSGGLKSILNIGTNIIQGICKGIDNASKNGSLERGITGFIRQVCNFITTNAPSIQKAGKQIIDAVMQGIENNKDKIRTAMDSICGIIETWVSGSAQLESAMGQFADVMMESLITQAGIKAQAKAGELWDAIGSMFTPDKMPDFSKGGTGILQWIDGCIDWSIERVGQGGEKTGQSYGEGVQRGADGTPLKLNPENFRQSYNEYGNYGLTGGQNFGVSTAKGIESTKSEIVAKGSEVGSSTAQAIQDSLDSMNTDQLQSLKTAIDEVGKATKSTATSMGKSFTSIVNSARTSFQGLFNIINNQMIKSTKAISDGISNARQVFTSKMISMRSVATTQCTLIRTVIVQKFMSIGKVISTQISSARNVLTSQFISMRKVAATQMAQVLSTVRSYMSQIAAACNRTLTLKVNINKTETTTKKVVVENGPMSLTMPQTSSLSASSYSGTKGVANSIGLGSLVGAVAGSTGSDRAISIEVPVVLEGRQIAKASAIYTREELAKLEKRSKRKRGE